MPDDVWYACSVADGPSCNWYEFLLGGDLLKASRPLVGLAPPPLRVKEGRLGRVADRCGLVTEPSVFGAGRFHVGYKRGAGAGVEGQFV